MPGNNLDKFKKIIDKLPSDKRKLLYNRLHDMPSSEREGFINDFVKKYDNRQQKSPDRKEPVKGNVPSQKKPVPKKDRNNKAVPSKNGPVNKKPIPQNADPARKPAAKNGPVNKVTPVKKEQIRKDAPHNAPVKKAVPQKPVPHKEMPHKDASHKETPRKKIPVRKELPPREENIDLDDLSYEESLNIEIPEKKIEEPKEPAEPKNPYMSVAVGLLSALLIIGLFYIVYLFNKQRIDGKFNEMFGMPPSDTISTAVETDDIVGPAPKHFPTDTPTPVPATPTPTPITLKDDHPNLKGKTIVIDPGHQAEANTEPENAIPKTSAEKDKATTGATGVDTGAKEYEITLRYALVVKEYLEGCGAKVILTRDTNEANISNIERAKIATDNKADYFIRLHADGIEDATKKGVKVYIPDSGKYLSSSTVEGKKLADMVAKEIGSTSLGVIRSKMYTGLNYADSVRSYQLVIGYISNSEDDALIANEDTPYKVAVAISEFLAK